MALQSPVVEGTRGAGPPPANQPFRRRGRVASAMSGVARDVLLGPPRGLVILLNTAAARPALLAAMTVLLICVPVGDKDVSASVHVTPADLGSVALVVSVLPRLLAGARLPRSWIWAAMGATVVGFAVATVASQDPRTSITGFVRYAQLFVIVPIAVVLAVQERRDQRLLCQAVLAAAVLEGAVGTWQVVTGTGASFAGQNVRAVGTFGAQDVMGMSTLVGYGMIVAVGLALVLRGRSRAALLALAALLVVPLLLSLSRGAVIATVGAIAMMLVAISPRLAVRTAVFGGAAAFVLLGVLGTATTVATRLATIGTSLSGPDRSVDDRYDLWHTAVAMWRDHPSTGVGVKMFPAYRDAYASIHLSSGSDVADPSLSFRREPLLSPHNMYLLVLSEQGLIGVTAFAGLLLALLVVTWRRTRQVACLGIPDGRLPDGRLVCAVAVGVVGWALLNFISSDIGGPPTILMPVLLGLALSWAVHPADVTPWRADR
jgi:O-Antigen ligase